MFLKVVPREVLYSCQVEVSHDECMVLIRPCSFVDKGGGGGGSVRYDVGVHTKVLSFWHYLGHLYGHLYCSRSKWDS